MGTSDYARSVAAQNECVRYPHISARLRAAHQRWVWEFEGYVRAKASAGLAEAVAEGVAHADRWHDQILCSGRVR